MKRKNVNSGKGNGKKKRNSKPKKISFEDCLKSAEFYNPDLNYTEIYVFLKNYERRDKMGGKKNVV